MVMATKVTKVLLNKAKFSNLQSGARETYKDEIDT